MVEKQNYVTKESLNLPKLVKPPEIKSDRDKVSSGVNSPYNTKIFPAPSFRKTAKMRTHKLQKRDSRTGIDSARVPGTSSLKVTSRTPKKEKLGEIRKPLLVDSKESSLNVV